MQYPTIQRRPTRMVRVGRVTLGGNAPVAVQSMTNTRTADAPATLAQIRSLVDAGADLVRVAVPTAEDTAALEHIVQQSPVPVVADVHFHFDRALEAIKAGCAKIRLNPGNIRDRDQVKRVIDAAGQAQCAIRVGVNEGSVPHRKDAPGQSLDRLMADKLDEYLDLFLKQRFDQLVLSAKSHDAVTTIEVNRRLAKRWNFPLHLGVTHAGTAQTGAIRSAAAMGALLAEGIGDTLRISYAGDPVAEVLAAVELLRSLRLRQRKGLELIACPTCGRLQMDLTHLIQQVQRELADVDQPLRVAIMGCVVNGPGEAQDADIAVCAGKRKALLYRNGRKLATIDEERILPRLIREVRKLLADRAQNAPHKPPNS